jgi:glycosyltransferase involved in cell wall biosynthesis
MRIGIDAHILGKGKGGVERVVHEMVRLLPDALPEHEFVILTNRQYVPPFPIRANVRYLRLAISEPILQRTFVLPWLSARWRLDLLHVQRAAPPCVRAKLVVHTHDLLPLTAPADHGGLRDRLVRLFTPGSLRRADRVLTVSGTAAAEIRGLFPDVAHKLVTIPNGIESGFFRPIADGSPRAAVHARNGLGGAYVLYVGAISPRKNLEVAIRGFCEFRQQRRLAGEPDINLVLAGMCRSQSYEARLRGLATELAPESICFAGFVTDGECLALLQHAFLFLAPSRGEGFDLPPLEAMACAIPVICSELPVHREVLEDDALYFHPDKPEELAAALQRAADDPALRAEYGRRGLIRAAKYTWARAMESLAILYRDLLPPIASNRILL